MENQEVLRSKDAANNAAHGDQNALINRLDMNVSNSNLMDTFQKAPDSAMARYGLVTVNGIAKVPEGLLNAVVKDVKNPLAAAETIGMGAGMAVVLKAVLPEGGPAGQIAGAAIGAYFTYKAAAPIIDAYKKAGNATTMRDLDAASTQIGNAGGSFIVDSALAGVGYKAGAFVADKALATSLGQGFTAAKNGMYENIGSKLSDNLLITSNNKLNFQIVHDGYGVIPPYMMDELAKRNPNNTDFLKTREKTAELENGSSKVKPNASGDYHGAREVYDAHGEEVQPGTKVRFEGEKPSGNIEADKAYDYTGEVRDFYLKEYGRNSIDGKGMKFVSTVNYGQNFENAFWDGKQMTYGKPGPDSPFRTFVLRDIAGHEITHGITEMEANTQYHGQSGALNESYSDVFGALIDQYAKHQTADKASWLTGEGVWKDNIQGRALRDMLNPGTAYDDPSIGKDPQPAHMDHYIKTYNDNGGVHYNSGIPNKAFATFAKSVGGYAWDDPGHIWFEARKAAGSNPSFGSFAYQTLEAAKNLGHADELPKLEAAWKAVGVIPDAHAVDVLTPIKAPAEPQVGWLRSLFRKAS